MEKHTLSAQLVGPITSAASMVTSKEKLPVNERFCADVCPPEVAAADDNHKIKKVAAKGLQERSQIAM